MENDFNFFVLLWSVFIYIPMLCFICVYFCYFMKNILNSNKGLVIYVSVTKYTHFGEGHEKTKTKFGVHGIFMIKFNFCVRWEFKMEDV